MCILQAITECSSKVLSSLGQSVFFFLKTKEKGKEWNKERCERVFMFLAASMCVKKLQPYYTTMKRKRALPAFLGVGFPSFCSANAAELPIKLWFTSVFSLPGFENKAQILFLSGSRDY